MSKKIRWSRCLSAEWETVKEICKKTNWTEEQAVKFIMEKNLSEPQNTYDNVLQTYLSMILFYDISKKTIHYYFVDKELRDFLQSNELMNYEDLKSYIKDKGNFYPVKKQNSSTDARIFDYPVCIHVPYEKTGYAFNYLIINDAFNLVAEHKGAFLIEGKQYKELSKLSESNLTKEQKEIIELYRLAFNSLAYVYCFPQYVKDGVPNPDIYKRSDCLCKKIITSKEFKEAIKEQKHSPTPKLPHIVRGHFMYLKDERYTYKQGQIVWRQAHMTKGKAKTIYTNEDFLKDNFAQNIS